MVQVRSAAFPLAALCALTPPLAAQETFVGGSPITELNQAGSAIRSATLTDDELLCIFSSDRPGGTGGFDLFSASRTDVGASFDAPVRLPGLSSDKDELGVCLSKDGLELYFASDRRVQGVEEIWVAARPNRSAPWGQPVRLGAAVNAPGVAAGDPHLSHDMLDIWFTVRTPRGDRDLFRACRTQKGAPWTARAPLSDLNTPFDETAPFDEANGGILWFASNRPGGAGGYDIWVAIRNAQGVYANAAPVASVNTPDDQIDVWRGGTTGRLCSIEARPVDPGFLRIWCTETTTLRILDCDPVYIPGLGVIWDCEWREFVVTHAYDWRPTWSAFSLIALQRAPSPISFPGIDGLLHLDPGCLFVLGSGQVGANGLVSLSWPTLPNLPGLMIHHQVLMVGPGTARLSQATAVRLSNSI